MDVMQEKDTKFNDISLVIIAGYIVAYIEVAFADFLHDFTNTEHVRRDISGRIIAIVIAGIALELMKNKTNIISSSFFSTGLILVILAVYDNIVECKDIDYDDIVYRFIYDGSFIAIIMFYYNKLIEYLKCYQRKYYNGPIYKVVQKVLRTLPIALYFGYRIFVKDIEESEENKIENNNEESKKLMMKGENSK